MACRPEGTSNNTSEDNVDSTMNSIIEKTTKVETSYEALNEMLINNQPIYGDYLVKGSEEAIDGSLQNHLILQESKDYIFVQSTDGGTDVSHYYLLSFSKDTGKLIDFIGAGTEAEGVDPYKINWESDTSFSTVDYQYELLEEEESGAYIKGNLLDSTVQYYSIAPNGLIVSRVKD